MPLPKLRIVINLGADVSRTFSIQPRQVHPMPSVSTLVFNLAALSCFAYVCASSVTSEAMVTLAWPPTPANPCLVVCPQGAGGFPLLPAGLGIFPMSHSLSISPAFTAHQHPSPPVPPTWSLPFTSSGDSLIWPPCPGSLGLAYLPCALAASFITLKCAGLFFCPVRQTMSSWVKDQDHVLHSLE